MPWTKIHSLVRSDDVRKEFWNWLLFFFASFVLRRLAFLSAASGDLFGGREG